MVRTLLACSLAPAGCGESASTNGVVPPDARVSGISTAPTAEKSAAGKPATAKRVSAID